MTEPLLQLTYISSRHPDMPPSAIDLILSASRLNNRRCDVTGFLLFNGHRFLQHLEGPPEAVEQTYARIKADSRHRGLVELGRKETDRRIFGSWAMAFEKVDSAAPERRRPLIEQVQSLVANVDAKVANHFLGYARLTGDTAA